MDIYGTSTLNRTVQTFFRPVMALLSLFFGEVQQSDVEKIYFDVKKGKKRLTPFVSPLVAGKLVESRGFTTDSFSPAYVKDKRVHEPNRALRRLAGETIGGSLTPVNRQQANLNEDLADQQDMYSMRREVMASEVLRTGKCTITGEDYPTVVVDFNRDPTHTILLGASVEWGDAGVDPLDDVEDWAQTVHNNSDTSPDQCIMDGKAWKLFRKGARFKELIVDDRTIDIDKVRVGMLAKAGLKYQGKVGMISFWTYSQTYVDEAGATQNVMPDYTVILASSGLQGVQHFGAIKDVDVLRAMESFTKSWVQEDPSARFVLMQGAPLVVPYNPNASFCATVKS